MANVVDAIEWPVDSAILTSGRQPQPINRARTLTPRPIVGAIRSVAAHFADQVRATPDNIAIAAGGNELSYAALDRAANRLAHAIIARRGTGAEPVALLIETGIAAIVGVLGVLKAGKFYVPLDPNHPRSRIVAVVADSDAPLLITTGRNYALAVDVAGDTGSILNLDALDPELSNVDPALDIPAETPLNIMYTSGSTGRPKGLFQLQRNLMHELLTVPDTISVRSTDRSVLLTSYSFGASAATIFAALLNGATLLPFDVKRAGIEALISWLKQERISVYHSVPTVLRHLLLELKPDDFFPHMRSVQLGGEAVYARDARLFAGHFPSDCIFRVGLGTTETYLVTRYFINDDKGSTEDVFPLGYPVEHKEVLILDETGTEVPTGETGEIVVKSHYLAPGYWNNPGATMAAFADAPDGSGARLYRTGDLGRRRADGCIEHLGRKDLQIKLRGHRVELSAIETKLLEVPGVREAVVVARNDDRDELRLVAYVVPSDAQSFNASEARAALLLQLPDYMLPSAFITVEKLPLLPFGKVDRKALPTPNWSNPDAETLYQAPTTPVEELLVATWQEVLGVARVGTADNFLALGGNSLLAAQIAARVEAAYGIDCPPGLLFDAPTVAALALEVTARLANVIDTSEMERLVAELEAMSDAEAQVDLGPEVKQIGTIA